MTATAPARVADLTERLRLYARYVSVVAEQLEAIREARTDGLDDLTAERTELEIRLGDAALENPALPPVGRVDDVLSLGLAAIDRNRETARLLEDRWSSLSAGALRTARAVSPPTIRGGHYPDAAAASKLDRRF